MNLRIRPALSEGPDQAFKTAEGGFWSGALFGMLTGMASLLVFQYLSGILRNPRLISKAIFSGDKQFDTHEALAVFIATEGLKSGILPRRLTNGLIKNVLHAGYRNFRESWARDFGFAAFGLLALEQYRIVEDTLEAFLWFQKADGQFPVKLHSMDPLTRFFHSRLGREQSIETRLKPKYVSAHGAPSLDGQALLVITALAYFRKTEDVIFLKRYWEGLSAAMQWISGFRRDRGDPLLYQGAFADWADSVARRGPVLYTNVVYWKALSEMAAAAEHIGYKPQGVQYENDALNLAQAIHERHWRPHLGYFVTSDRLDQLSSDGNLLAIAWGLATAEQAESVLKVMEKAGMAEPVPTRVAYPSYPPEFVALENYLAGVPNYHTNSAWLWLGAWHVIALVRRGHLEEAQTLLSRLAEVIVRDQQVNEVYASNGQPMASFWYRFESPLIWNAGMFIYACHVFESERNRPLPQGLPVTGRK